jgi:hypothetical protein
VKDELAGDGGQLSHGTTPDSLISATTEIIDRSDASQVRIPTVFRLNRSAAHGYSYPPMRKPTVHIRFGLDPSG